MKLRTTNIEVSKDGVKAETDNPVVEVALGAAILGAVVAFFVGQAKKKDKDKS